MSSACRSRCRTGQGRRSGLDVQRLRMDFTLPAQSGEGRPLSGRELQDLLDRESPSVFFSQDCAPGISPMPGTARRISSSSTTRTPFPRSCGPAGTWLRRRLPDVSGGAGSAAQAVSRAEDIKSAVPFGTALFLDRSIIALLVLASGLRLLAALDAGLS